MPRSYWLVKSEPMKYAWERFVADGRTRWDGVRNAEARNHLKAMRKGDLALFYHSNEGREVVGVARVVAEAHPDPTSPGESWVTVGLEPLAPLAKPVSLADIKAEPALAGMALVRRSRLSVSPVAKQEFEAILQMGGTKLARGG